MLRTAPATALLFLLVACKGGGDDDPQRDDSSGGAGGGDDSTPTDDSGTSVPAEGPWLRSLALSQGTITPAFRTGQLHYTVEGVDLSAATTTVTAEASDPDAVVTITHASMDGVPSESGASPLDVALVESQRLDVSVTVDGEEQVYSVLALTASFPDLEVRVASEDAWDGYVFLGNFPFAGPGPDYEPTIFILDRAGQPVWFRTIAGPGLDFKPTPDGRLTMVSLSDVGAGFAGYVLDGSYETVRTIHPLGKGYDMDHREFRILPGGNAIVLSTLLREIDLTDYGSEPGCCSVQNFIFQELDPEGGLVFEWKAQDHLDELFADLPDAKLEHLTDNFDYAHINSLDLDPTDGNWIISARFVSEVLKVARYETKFKGVTYAPGDIVWRLGGKNSDFEIIGDDRAGGWKGFSDQHSARVPEPGRLLVYDNANWPDIGPTGDSRYVEYAYDEETLTATKVGEYAIAGSSATEICGSVARLPNGSTLIGWGSLNHTYPDAPAVTEVTAEGEVVLEIVFPPSELSYRAGFGVWDTKTHTWTGP
jgi:hypothetical protein